MSRMRVSVMSSVLFRPLVAEVFGDLDGVGGDLGSVFSGLGGGVVDIVPWV